MKPAQFQEQTKVLAKPPGMTDEECGELAVHCDGQICTSLWVPSWRERISILFFGRVWLRVWMGQTQPPVYLEGARTIFVKVKT